MYMYYYYKIQNNDSSATYFYQHITIYLILIGTIIDYSFYVTQFVEKVSFFCKYVLSMP